MNFVLPKIDGRILLASTYFFIIMFLFASQSTVFFDGDGQNHYEMSKNLEEQNNYSPLFRFISAPFSFNPYQWIAFVVFIFGLVFPLTVYLITREPMSVFFYFLLTSFFYWIFNGIFSQMLMFYFVLLFLLVKNNFLRLGILLIGLASHSTAPILLPLALFLILLNENKHLMEETWNKIKKDFHAGYVVAGVTLSIQTQGFLNSIIFFLSGSPFPFVFVALKHIVLTKRIDLLALFVIGVIGIPFFGLRSGALASLMVCLGFSFAWKKLKRKQFWFLLMLAWWITFLF